MRLLTPITVLSVTAFAAAMVFSACGGPTDNRFGDAGAGTDDGAVGQNDGDPVIDLGDADTDGAHPCVNLECQQVTCGGGATTSISGKVYDPAGVNPLYNVYVYVPNAPLQPFAQGVTCTACQAPASGNPVVSTTTKADGSFTLKDVPVGSSIPLVLQLGKWRRHLTIGTVKQCTDNPQPDKSLRFPRKQHETSPDDNIPLIALTTGCDGAECFLKSRIGIDPSEFTSPTGKGRVHVYKSQYDDGQTFSGGSGSATALWASSAEMLKHDIVFDACECSTFDRGGAGGTNQGYKNMLAYLNGGGRAFATHFFYNFFSTKAQCGGYDNTCQGQNPLPTVGAWEGNQYLPDNTHSTYCPLGGYNVDRCFNIDVAIPKGQAFADWYKDNNTKIDPSIGGGEQHGYAGLNDIRYDMGQLSSSLVAAGTATPWLYNGDIKSNYDAYYFSFNTPVSTNVQNQCGKAIFSDVHLSDAPYGSFPSYCATDPNKSPHAADEMALEFLFFDLSSCVQDETQPPPEPPH